MNVVNTPFARRAADLQAALPQDGDPKLREEKAHEAVDTLVREFPTLPEADLGRLTCKMASKSMLPENCYRTGLEAASQGTAGTGSALAGLAVKLLASGPQASRDGMRAVAYKTLQPRADLEPTMCLGPLVEPSWLPHHHFTAEETDRTHQELLEAASYGDKPRKTALRILVEDLQEGQYTGGWAPCSSGYELDVNQGIDVTPETGRDRTLAKGLLKAVLDRPGTAQTYAAAQQALKEGGSPVEVARTFLSQDAADSKVDTYAWAQSLARSAGGYRRPDTHDLEAALQSQGNEAYKYLHIVADSKLALGGLYGGESVCIHAIAAALQRVHAEPEKVGPQQLVRFLADISPDRIELSDGECGHMITPACILPSVAPRLAELAPTTSWKAAFQVLELGATRFVSEGWEYQATELLNRMAGVQDGQSPLLATVTGFAKFRGGYGDEDKSRERLDTILSSAQGLAQDAHEIEVLGKARGILQAQGMDAASQYLEGSGRPGPETPVAPTQASQSAVSSRAATILASAQALARGADEKEVIGQARETLQTQGLSAASQFLLARSEGAVVPGGEPSGASLGPAAPPTVAPKPAIPPSRNGIDDLGHEWEGRGYHGTGETNDVDALGHKWSGSGYQSTHESNDLDALGHKWSGASYQSTHASNSLDAVGKKWSGSSYHSTGEKNWVDALGKKWSGHAYVSTGKASAWDALKKKWNGHG